MLTLTQLRKLSILAGNAYGRQNLRNNTEECLNLEFIVIQIRQLADRIRYAQ